MKKAPFLPVLIGTGFGSGFSPFAPGTAGALLASIIWIALYLLLPFSVVLWITAALVIVFTFAGIWAADKLEACWGEDPSRVVVKWSECGYHCLPFPTMTNGYGMWWRLSSCSVHSTLPSHWASAKWRVSEVG